MSGDCCIANCWNEDYGEAKNELVLFQFPTNWALRQCWLNAVSSNLKIGSFIRGNFHICQLHFKGDDFEVQLQTNPDDESENNVPVYELKLKSTSVPSIFNKDETAGIGNFENISIQEEEHEESPLIEPHENGLSESEIQNFVKISELENDVCSPAINPLEIRHEKNADENAENNYVYEEQEILPDIVHAEIEYFGNRAEGLEQLSENVEREKFPDTVDAEMEYLHRSTERLDELSENVEQSIVPDTIDEDIEYLKNSTERLDELSENVEQEISPDVDDSEITSMNSSTFQEYPEGSPGTFRKIYEVADSEIHYESPSMVKKLGKIIINWPNDISRTADSSELEYSTISHQESMPEDSEVIFLEEEDESWAISDSPDLAESEFEQRQNVYEDFEEVTSDEFHNVLPATAFSGTEDPKNSTQDPQETKYDITTLIQDLHIVTRHRKLHNWRYSEVPFGLLFYFRSEDPSNATKTILVRDDMTLKIVGEGRTLKIDGTEKVECCEDILRLLRTVSRLYPCGGAEAGIPCPIGFFESSAKPKTIRCIPCREERKRRYNKLARYARTFKRRKF